MGVEEVSLILSSLINQERSNEKYRIAIIDDDTSIQNLVQMSVRAALKDVELLKFGDARETIFELWESSPAHLEELDLLFLDIHLNNMTNGMDILEYSQYIPQNLPVILMSSTFSLEQLEAIEKMKVPPALLRKPFGPTEIIGMTKWIFQH